MAEPVVSIRGFSKSYGGVRAVRDLTFDVQPGELFGMIGPDGAGKTTTMRTVVTLLSADEGELRVCGHDVRTGVTAIRAVTGYMPQRFSLYPDLSVDQNLTFFADLFGVPKKEQEIRKQRLYKFSRLEAFSKRLAGRLSGGMKQKLALSCTLIHNPELLVLDEPTTGVDPVSRNEFWTILRELTAQGVTIIVSTPYMDEALLCDRTVVMHGGRVLAAGDPRALTAQFEGEVFAVREPDLVLRTAALRGRPGILGVHAFGGSLHVTAAAGTSVETIRASASQAFGREVDVARIAPTLEDLFIHLIEERSDA